MSTKLTLDNFKDVVIDSKVPVLIDFYADWCGPCKMVAPQIEQLSEEMRGLAKVCKVNIDTESELAHHFGISSIPTFVVIKDNEVQAKVSGLKSKQQLKNMLVA